MANRAQRNLNISTGQTAKKKKKKTNEKRRTKIKKIQWINSRMHLLSGKWWFHIQYLSVDLLYIMALLSSLALSPLSALVYHSFFHVIGVPYALQINVHCLQVLHTFSFFFFRFFVFCIFRLYYGNTVYAHCSLDREHTARLMKWKKKKSRK